MVNITVKTDAAREMDRQAHTEWGMNPFALIEAAGQHCARVFAASFPAFFAGPAPRVTVFAGSGNNGADALTMLRVWLLSGLVDPASSRVVVGKARPGLLPGDPLGPSDSLLLSLSRMKVPITVWNQARPPCIEGKSLVIDGITGTGVRCPLEGVPRSMAVFINGLAEQDAGDRPFVVSVDLPSGLGDGWKAGMPLVHASATLAIEPQKTCLYTPSARAAAGTILPVTGIFPGELLRAQTGPELLDWAIAKRRIAGVQPDIHKYGRGCVEIRAGSTGAVGAAVIAARGSQAAGAGLVRLVVDPEIYLPAASGASGVMVAPSGVPKGTTPEHWTPDAILAGPGWGRGPDRAACLQTFFPLEETGTPLVLDADGIHLARGTLFHGNALLTPHVGEFAAFTGCPAHEILDDPLPLLVRSAARVNAVILLKSHVMFLAAPDGRAALIDGLLPNLASGGSGDLLAGFAAAIAARMARHNNRDLYTAAAAAACLLIKAGSRAATTHRFTDPAELADAAASIAGRAWLADRESRWKGPEGANQ